MGEVLSFDIVSDVYEDTGADVTVTSIYECRVTDPETAPFDLRIHRPDLLRYNGHPKNGSLPKPVYVTRWRCDPDDRDPTGLFVVTVDYSFGAGDSRRDQRYLIRTPTWRTSYVQTQVHKSPNDGKPFLNKAGDPITGIMENQALWTADYEFNVPSRPLWLQDYAWSINSDTVRLDGFTYGPFQVAMGEITVTPEIDEDGIEYRKIGLQLVTHPEKEGWIRQFPNVGYYEIGMEIGRVYITAGLYGQGPTGRKIRKRIVDQNDEPIERPTWLDKDGAAIRHPVDPARPAVIPPIKVPLADTDFIWLKLDTRRQLPFARLRLR